MYFVPYVIGLLCLVPPPGQSQISSPSTTPSSVVCWQENHKLTWKDFQAKVKPETPDVDSTLGVFVGATTEANAVVYDRMTDSGEFVKTFVRVEFDKQKSWVNKVNTFNRRAALKHEQLHFDITELTGRKIRRVLARCAARHISYHTPAITQEITRIYNEEVRLDGLYDKEAGYGDNPKAQARWQALIQKQLDALRAYKSTPADCEMPQ